MYFKVTFGNLALMSCPRIEGYESLKAVQIPGHLTYLSFLALVFED
jgi:hypothetical protein